MIGSIIKPYWALWDCLHDSWPKLVFPEMRGDLERDRYDKLSQNTGPRVTAIEGQSPHGSRIRTLARADRKVESLLVPSQRSRVKGSVQ